jgi:hypothetical protein
MGTGSISEGDIAVRSVTIRCHRSFSSVGSARYELAGDVGRTDCEMTANSEITLVMSNSIPTITFSYTLSGVS